jgi:DMSO/TMAO reductase YedYZ heme-binding membrane subunit
MTPPLAVAGPSAYWYLARATGMVSLVLLTASVVLGVLGPLRVSSPPRWPRFAVDTLHRDVSLLVVVLLAVHILTSVLDSFTSISLINSVIPFTGSYRPLWLGFGALSFDLMIALVVTSIFRRRLGYGAWRAIHWLAYASWPVAVLHGLGSGSDTKSWWALALTVACVAAVAVAIWIRVQGAEGASESVRGPALVATVIIPLGIALFTFLGPLQHGWARRAGTPSSLLVPTSATAIRAVSTKRVATTSPRTTLKTPFTARLEGSVAQSTVPGGAIVDLALRISGGARGRLRVRLAGAPIPGGGLSMTGSQVVLEATGLPTVMEGTISSLVGQQFVARLHGADGSQLELHATLNLDGPSGTATGSLSARTPAGGGG